MPERKTTKTRRKAKKASTSSSKSYPQSRDATITSAVCAEPELAPLKAASRLFPNPPAWKRAILRFKIKEQLEEGRGKGWNWHKGAVHDKNREPGAEELQMVRERYGYKAGSEGGPSELYLKILADAMLPLPRYPLSGVVSPSLLATTGIVPFSVFSTGPDIIQHYYDCIVAAKKEVVLLTNYWQLGKNVDRISDAFRELNSRQQKRKEESSNSSNENVTGEKNDKGNEKKNGRKMPNSHKVDLNDQIVVKLMWDRGPQNLADLFRARKPVLPPMWKSNGLPTQEEVPYLNIEILNYHRPLMGTFHAKLLLVDRQVALINSNNIQDRPNIEACTRLEGDIVNSVYDHALISWGNRLKPPLPCLSFPAPEQPSPGAFSVGDESTLPHITASKLREIASSIRQRLHQDDEEAEDEKSARQPIRRLSFADVVDNVIRRENTPYTHPTPGASQKPAREMDPSERDRAARNAGAEWARKVLGERFNSNYLPQAFAGSPSDTQATSSPPDGSQPHNRRHFADVVYALMEKEGIKPNLWAEGALDAFGLGPSSSRNVADEARRSRTAAKANLNIPKAVMEEKIEESNDAGPSKRAAEDDTPQIIHQATSEALAEQSKPQENDNQNALDSLHTNQNMTDNTERVEMPQAFPSANEQSAATQSSQNTGNDSATIDSATSRDVGGEEPSNSVVVEEGDLEEEGAPGSRAYQQRHRRTMSTRSRASATERLAIITKSLDFANLSQVKGEITAQQLAAMTDRATQGTDEFMKGAAGEILDFNPYIFHLPHAPVPIALVNRRPHGTPGHSDIRNAQDAAWLAGFRYAKHHIFIQSPTLNATPIKHAVLHAVRRHVRVELWLGLGFNDKSESMPFQGGTNEQVVTRLYRQLRREGKGDEKYLEVFWYTGKDMTRPLNAVRKQRNCHVKYAQFDGQVAIIGSGNQDTQSWYHSQEINVMVDDRQIVGEWDRGLRRNQSTHLYGKVDSDGIWRGRTGAEKVDKGGD